MFDNKTITTSELPAIFVNGIVPLPHNEIRIDLSSAANLSALKVLLLQSLQPMPAIFLPPTGNKECL